MVQKSVEFSTLGWVVGFFEEGLIPQKFMVKTCLILPEYSFKGYLFFSYGGSDTSNISEIQILTNP